MPPDDNFKSGQEALWNRMAVGWDRRYEEIERLSKPANQWLCDAAELREGMTVLDIASGSGQPAFMAAARVAPGRVTATDISSVMVEGLRRRAAAEGVLNLDAVVADMDDLRFEDGRFDAVTCRWGFMFSRQPVKALSEARRVLKPGGKLATATWDGSAPVPLGTLLTQIMDVMAGKPPGREPLPSPLDTPDDLAIALEHAGFDDISVVDLRFSFDFESPEEWWDFILEVSTPNKLRVDALGEADLAEARRLFREEAEKQRRGNRIVVPAVCICAVGTH